MSTGDAKCSTSLALHAAKEGPSLWVDRFSPRRSLFPYYLGPVKNLIDCGEGSFCWRPKTQASRSESRNWYDRALGFSYLDGLNRALDFASSAKDAVLLPGRVRFPDR